MIMEMNIYAVKSYDEEKDYIFFDLEEAILCALSEAEDWAVYLATENEDGILTASDEIVWKERIYSVELKDNNWADDSFNSYNLSDCIEWLKEEGYYNNGDAWRIVYVSLDEHYCVDFCHEIYHKEDVE